VHPRHFPRLSSISTPKRGHSSMLAPCDDGETVQREGVLKTWPQAKMLWKYLHIAAVGWVCVGWDWLLVVKEKSRIGGSKIRQPAV